MGTHKYSINIATAWVTIVLRHMPGALGNHSTETNKEGKEVWCLCLICSVGQDKSYHNLA